MPEPTLVNPLEQEDWNNLLLNSQDYSFFQTANWADVLIKSYNYEPFYFCNVYDKLNNLLPLLEVSSPITGKRGVCLPFSDLCNPIAVNRQQFQYLLSKAITLGQERRWKYLEIRGGKEYLSAQKPSEVFYGHTLDLKNGHKKIFSKFRDSTRRNIKKAQSGELKVQISHSLKAVKEFCRLNVLTRKEHGLPPQPYSFFNHLYECVINQGMGFVVTASVSDQVIAANIYLNFGNKVVYKYGASDKTFQHLRANNLIMWEAIKWICDKGYQYLCFGRTENENKGLMQFKAGWAAESYQIFYYRYDFQKRSFTGGPQDINPLARKTFSKLPLSVLEMLGKILYRHMG